MVRKLLGYYFEYEGKLMKHLFYGMYPYTYSINHDLETKFMLDLFYIVERLNLMNVRELSH